MLLQPVQPVGLQQRRDEEFVEKPLEDPLHRRVQILQKLVPAADAIPILPEAPVAIDRPGGDGRKEKEVAEKLRTDCSVVMIRSWTEKTTSSARKVTYEMPMKPSIPSGYQSGKNFEAQSGRMVSPTAA